jgi:dsRNA-specific ribonuclease
MASHYYKKTDEEEVIYLGPRGDEFKAFIKSLLEKGRLFPKYIDLLLSEESMIEYGKAFTSDTVDIDNNYQVYEQLGDVVINKFIVKYMYKKFPELRCSEAVKIVSRMKIVYGSKEEFFDIAEPLGFKKFISATETERKRQERSLIEDVFEAFIGCTEDLLDNYTRQGVGNAICYDILTSIFDELPINIDYYELVDAKTILKETFDVFKELGTLVYEEKRIDPASEITTSEVYQVLGRSKNLIATATGYKKSKAQQNAAKMAVKYLATKGYKKPVPEVYIKFCKKT